MRKIIDRFQKSYYVTDMHEGKMDRSAIAHSAARFVQGEMKDIKDFLSGTLQPKSYISNYYEAADHLHKSIAILKENYPSQHSADYDLRTNAHYTITLQDMLKVAALDAELAEPIFDFLSPETKKDHPRLREACSNINIIISRSNYRTQLKINRSYENARRTLGLAV